MHKIRTAIVGYGNLGKAAEAILKQSADMELAGIFTRRPPEKGQEHISQLESFRNQIDVCILCGGSAVDLPIQGPEIAAQFNTVDSFDNHTAALDYYTKMNHIAKAAGKLSIISVGWDPGLFSLNRLLGHSILLNGADYTFWGRGVSQGHSDAIRRIEGVLMAVQYSIPQEEALRLAKSGEQPSLTKRQMHKRECFVVIKDGADPETIEQKIKTMPHYFADYDTSVTFISAEEFTQKHHKMPHGGHVIRVGESEGGMKQRMEFSLELESNPAFTASILVCYARAAHRLATEGQTGARTILDVPVSYTSPLSTEELIKDLL